MTDTQKTDEFARAGRPRSAGGAIVMDWLLFMSLGYFKEHPRRYVLKHENDDMCNLNSGDPGTAAGIFI